MSLKHSHHMDINMLAVDANHRLLPLGGGCDLRLTFYTLYL